MAIFKRNFSVLPKEATSRKFFIKTLVFAVPSVAVLVGPMLYLVFQNYSLFLNLAKSTHPELISALEREIVLLSLYSLASSIGLILFYAIFIPKAIHRFTGPVLKIETHMRSLIHDKWEGHALKLRRSDEFKEFVRVYNYFWLLIRSRLSQLESAKKESSVIQSSGGQPEKPAA